MQPVQMHHDELDRDIVVDSTQVSVHEKSGWRVASVDAPEGSQTPGETIADASPDAGDDAKTVEPIRQRPRGSEVSSPTTPAVDPA